MLLVAIPLLVFGPLWLSSLPLLVTMIHMLTVQLVWRQDEALMYQRRTLFLPLGQAKTVTRIALLEDDHGHQSLLCCIEGGNASIPIPSIPLLRKATLTAINDLMA